MFTRSNLAMCALGLTAMVVAEDADAAPACFTKDFRELTNSDDV